MFLKNNYKKINKKGMARWFLAFLILALVFLVLMTIWFVSLKGTMDGLFDSILGWF